MFFNNTCREGVLIVPLFNASILRRNTNMPSCNVKVVTYHNATRYFSTINVTSNMLRCDMQTCHLFFVATRFSQPFISSSHSFLAATQIKGHKYISSSILILLFHKRFILKHVLYISLQVHDQEFVH